MTASVRRFRRDAIVSAVDEMLVSARNARTAARPSSPGGAGPSRRRFLQLGAATATLGGLPWLASCGGSDGDSDFFPRRKESRTIFFNHSHLDHAGKQMSLQVGIKVYRLRPVAEVPHVLARERAGNKFLAAVPDRQITHVAEAVEVDPDYVQPIYAFTDQADGAWTLDGVHLTLPQSSAAVAYSRLAARPGPREPSAKRRKYQLGTAASAQDLHDEQALMDTSSHAAALIAMHKDMFAIDGNSGNTVVNVHVMNSNGVFDLDDYLTTKGTAAPETTPGTPNTDGWASLRPIVDPATNQPARMTGNDERTGSIIYYPVLEQGVVAHVRSGVLEVLPQVQDDEALGADITARPDGSTLKGALWVRQDGTPNNTLPGASVTAEADAPHMEVLWPNGQNHWLDCSANVTSNSDGSLQLDVTLTNSGLRYLSAWIELEREDQSLIPMSQMPGWSKQQWITSPPNWSHTPVDGSQTRQALGGINSMGTIMGIPVYTDSAFYGSLSFTATLPNTVHKVRLFAGGLGSGSNDYADTIAGGVAGTMLINYCMTVIFAALGAVPDMDIVFSITTALGSTFLNDLASGLLDKFSGNDWLTPQFWIDQGLNLLGAVVGVGVGKAAEVLAEFVGKMQALLVEIAVEEAIERACVVAGIVMNIESALMGAADFALTTVAIAQSPFTYVTELVFTHSLTVAITTGDSEFPQAANAMRVVAKFDDGKPHTSEWLPVPPGNATSFTAHNVPFGGNVTFDVFFVQRATDGNDDDSVLLGVGSSGAQPNDDVTTYSVTIVQRPFPIGKNTLYQHKQRTYLDADDNHVWVAEAAPSTPPSSFPCGSAGQVCSYNGIAVREGNAAKPKMLAYAWAGQNKSGGAQVVQAALMNADDPTGYSVNALPPTGGALTLAISRDVGGSNNFYVDATTEPPLIRAINFDTGGNPTIDGPGSNRAYGALNYASSALLVHPSGALVSVADGKNRLELLTPPDTPVTDEEARQSHIAQVLGYGGTRPGCFSDVTGATITNDGVLLVLEKGNNRVQAFDLGLNPVRYFTNAPTPYFLQLDALASSDGWTHLDIQADVTGFVFLLSRQGSITYQLSVFDPEDATQTPKQATTNIYAARIGVDHWRSVYTLNYQPITVQGTGAAPEVTEPSVSLWVPCNQGQTCPVS